MQYKLGYIADTHDFRDFKWDHIQAAQHIVLPPKFMCDNMGPVLNQGQTSECVCYSMATIKMQEEFLETQEWWMFDPDTLYAACKQIDGMPNVNGTVIRIACQIAQSTGMYGTLNDSQKTANFKIKDYVRLRNQLSIKQALSVDGPVIFGMNVDSGIESPISGFVNDPNNDHIGGHCMVMAGYNDDIKGSNWANPGGYWVKNSWDISWGLNGYAWIPYSWFDTYTDFDAWRVTNITNMLGNINAATTA